EPVPAMTITPGPLPNAASSAITVSPTTSTAPPTILESTLDRTVVISGLPAPEAPIQVRLISAGEIFATAHACRIAASSDSPAIASPTRTTLLGPALPAPSTALSSPIRQEVLVPPP